MKSACMIQRHSCTSLIDVFKNCVQNSGASHLLATEKLNYDSCPLLMLQCTTESDECLGFDSQSTRCVSS